MTTPIDGFLSAPIFLCGVTPEIALWQWPFPTGLIGMDHVESMVRIVPPGDIPGVLLIVQSATGAGGLNAIAGLDFTEYPHIMVALATKQPSTYFAVTKILLAPSAVNKSFRRVAAEALINGIPPLVSTILYRPKWPSRHRTRRKSSGSQTLRSAKTGSA